jgi:uncharacterized protein YndB with AHSA1/START domain
MTRRNANDTISIEILIHASPREVWKAWTDPALILKWFGSEAESKGLKAELDMRPGGSYEISFGASDGSEHTCGGVYIVVREFSKLVFTWTWKSEPGVESIVTVLLSPEADHTRMLFEHAHVGNASKHDYLDGWQGTFSKLGKILGSKETNC